MSYTNFVLPISQAVVKAYTAIGLKPVDGFNSGGLIGWAPMTLTLDPKDQTRSSSETSFLREGIKKPTFVVYSYTVATKIIFSGKKASGVAVERSDIKFNLSAKKSVIISAGTVKYPCLHETQFRFEKCMTYMWNSSTPLSSSCFQASEMPPR